MGLQSPARLANSRTSSTNTLKQHAANVISAHAEKKDSVATLSNQDSPRKVDQVFLFNNQSILQPQTNVKT